MADTGADPDKTDISPSVSGCSKDACIFSRSVMARPTFSSGISRRNS